MARVFMSEYAKLRNIVQQVSVYFEAAVAADLNHLAARFTVPVRVLRATVVFTVVPTGTPAGTIRLERDDGSTEVVIGTYTLSTPAVNTNYDLAAGGQKVEAGEWLQIAAAPTGTGLASGTVVIEYVPLEEGA